MAILKDVRGEEYSTDFASVETPDGAVFQVLALVDGEVVSDMALASSLAAEHMASLP